MQNCQAGNGTVDEKSLPDEIKDYLGHILFSHINGPGNFYVRMQYKEYDFDNMTLKLKIQSEMTEEMASSDIKPGTFVAVLYVLHENFIPTWNRAFVNEVNPDLRQANVIFPQYQRQ